MKQKIIILLLLYLLGCYLTTNAQLSESTLDSIILELQSYDQLKVKYNEQTKEYTILVAETQKRKEDIQMYVLQIEDFKKLVANLEEQNKVDKLIWEDKTKRKNRKIVILVLTNILTLGLLLI